MLKIEQNRLLLFIYFFFFDMFEPFCFIDLYCKRSKPENSSNFGSTIEKKSYQNPHQLIFAKCQKIGSNDSEIQT